MAAAFQTAATASFSALIWAGTVGLMNRYDWPKNFLIGLLVLVAVTYATSAMGHFWGGRSYAGLYGFGVYALFELVRSETFYLRSDQLGWWLYFFLPVVLFYASSVAVLRLRGHGKTS
jgi:hypothetical protein